MDSGLHTAVCGYQHRMRCRQTKSEEAFQDVIIRFFKIKRSKVKKHQIDHLKNNKIIPQKIFYFKLCDGSTKAYITDFYLPKYRLVIEIDGKDHQDRYKQAADAERTRLLRLRGIRVVRVSNETAMDKEASKAILIDAVAGKVKPKYRQKIPTAISIPRHVELAMQDEFIKAHGVTKIPAAPYTGSSRAPSSGRRKSAVNARDGKQTRSVMPPVRRAKSGK